MNTRIVTRTRAGLIAMAAVFTAGTVSGPASAAGFGGALQPGSTVCTDWLRTDGRHLSKWIRLRLRHIYMDDADVDQSGRAGG